MDRLLESYNRTGNAVVKREHVHLHELALAARWYKAALRDEAGHALDTHLQFFRGLLRRVSGAP